MDELRPTNTLAAIALDSLKLNTIGEDPFTNIHSMVNTNMEESCFVSIINKINENSKIQTKNKINLYELLALNKDEMILMESFADYHVQASEIIKKFLHFLVNKVNTFNSSMQHFIDDQTPIREHKADLENIKHYEDDGKEGYEYTIHDNIPNIMALDRFNASLFDDLFKSSVTDFSVDSIQTAIGNLNVEQEYALFRGELLGHQSAISNLEFSRELYRVFRDGNDAYIELNIDTEMIQAIVEQWFNYNTIKQNLVSQIKIIAKMCEDILAKIATVTENNNGLTLQAFSKLLPGDIRVTSVNGKDVDTEGYRMAPDMVIQIDLYCKIKLDQLEKYTNYICMAMGAKMDAIQAMYMQSRSILLDAVHMIEHKDAYGIDILSTDVIDDGESKVIPEEV